MNHAMLFSAFAMAASLAAAPCVAQDPGTLDKIKQTGVITLGHRESSVPFSYYDDAQNVVGYSQELMLKVVDESALRRAERQGF